MKLVYKIWLNNNDGRAFGEGPYRLLKGVELTGSLKKSAAVMGMAYSKARRVTECCERNLGFALLERKRGGPSGGGGSEVTAEAVGLMREYELIRAETEKAIAGAYKKHFGESVEVEFYRGAKRRKFT
jgi:molybdate transport system regulatory protein